MSIIKINNLEYNYRNKKIFDNLDLSIDEGTFITICGKSGSGKTTLLKTIIGLTEFNGSLEINGLKMNEKNKKDIRKNIGVVFENPDNSLIEDTVLENIVVPLQNMEINDEEIKKRLEQVDKYLNIKELYDLSINTLSGGEKQLISLAVAISKFPKILILDDFSSMLDGIAKEKLYKILKKLNRDEKMTIISFSSNTEDSLYGKEICLINEGKIILKNKISKAFVDEKVFKECDLEIPFMVNLCNKLKYYNLVDKVTFNMDKLVNQIWK